MFFLLRDLSLTLRNEPETKLPLTNQDNMVKTSDKLDLSKLFFDSLSVFLYCTHFHIIHMQISVPYVNGALKAFYVNDIQLELHVPSPAWINPDFHVRQSPCIALLLSLWLFIYYTLIITK